MEWPGGRLRHVFTIVGVLHDSQKVTTWPLRGLAVKTLRGMPPTLHAWMFSINGPDTVFLFETVLGYLGGFPGKGFWDDVGPLLGGSFWGLSGGCLLGVLEMPGCLQ